MATVKVRSDARHKYDPKKKVATYALKDLIRKRPSSKLLEIEPAPVEVEIEFPTDVGKTAWTKFFLPVISAEVKRYQEVIEAEAKVLAGKIDALAKKGDADGVKAMVESTQKSIDKAVATLETQLPALLQAELKRLAKTDRALRNARLKIAFKVGRILFKVGANIATLVGSAGADVTAWLSIVKELKNTAQLIIQETKNEQQLKNDLHKGFKAYIDGLSTTGRPAKKALVAYRNKNTKLKNRVLSTAKKSDGLAEKMREAKDLKGGVAFGAQAMTMSRRTGDLVESYRDVEAYADRYESTLAESKQRLEQFVARELESVWFELGNDGEKVDSFLALAEKYYGYLEEIADNIEEIAYVAAG